MSHPRLPNSLPKLIDLATTDFEKVLADQEHYKVCMSYWHKVWDDGKCYVCYAGSVLAGTLKVPPHATILTVESFPVSVRVKLMALDFIRSGDVYDAYSRLKQECPLLAPGRDRAVFEAMLNSDWPAFIKALRALAQRLREAEAV